MARTFLDLQNEVLLDEFDATKYRTLVKSWMNEAAQKISREVDLPQLESRVTFTQTGASYSLPADVMIITSVWAGTDQLDEVDVDDIDAYPTSSGTPTVFAVYGSTLTFYPTPSGQAMSMRYIAELPDLTTTSDTAALTFPDDFADLLVDYARSKAADKEDDLEMSQFYRARYDAGLARMRGQIQTRTRGRVRQIQGMMPVRSSPTFRRP